MSSRTEDNFFIGLANALLVNLVGLEGLPEVVTILYEVSSGLYPVNLMGFHNLDDLVPLRI